MNSTKTKVEEAILTIAKSLDKDKGFAYLIQSNEPLPKLVQIISYDMFLAQFDSRSCTEELYSAFIIIYEYAKELELKGFVEFN